MAAPGQGCHCECTCHVHIGGKCRNSALPGSEWCFGCVSLHGCDREAERRVAYLAAEAEKDARRAAAKAAKT